MFDKQRKIDEAKKMALKIPGLIGKIDVEMEKKMKEMQEFKMKSHMKGLMEQMEQMDHDKAMTQQSKAANTGYASVGYVGTTGQWVNGNPLAQPYAIPHLPYAQPSVQPYNTPPFGPGSNYNPLNQIPVTQYMRPKSALQELLEDMYTEGEKEQFLIDLGYEFYVNSVTGADEFHRQDQHYNKIAEMELVFLKEVKIKFKKMLLQKPTMRMKF